MLIVRGSTVCVLLFLVLCIVCTKVYGKSSFVSEINSFNFWLFISKSYNLSILLNNVAAMSLFLFHFKYFLNLNPTVSKFVKMLTSRHFCFYLVFAREIEKILKFRKIQNLFKIEMVPFLFSKISLIAFYFVCFLPLFHFNFKYFLNLIPTVSKFVKMLTFRHFCFYLVFAREIEKIKNLRKTQKFNFFFKIKMVLLLFSAVSLTDFYFVCSMPLLILILIYFLNFNPIEFKFIKCYK